MCGMIGAVVLGGCLVIALGIWLVTGQSWPLFDPRELPWVLMLMVLCLMMHLAATKLGGSFTAGEFRAQAGADATDGGKTAPAEPPHATGWGYVVGKVFGIIFQSATAWRIANLSALGFLGCLGFTGFPGWHRLFGLFGFFGLIGVAFLVELYGRGGRQAAARPSPARIAFATGIASLFAGLLAGIPFAGMFRVQKDPACIAVVVVSVLAALFAGFRVWAVFQQPDQPAAPRWWLRPLAWMTLVAAVPVVGLALSFVTQLPQGFDHPTPSEALLVPLCFIGAVALPLAGMVLMRASATRHVAPPATAGVNPWPRRLFMLLLALLVVPAMLTVAILVSYRSVSYRSPQSEAHAQRARAMAEQEILAARLAAAARAQNEISTQGEPWIVAGRVVDDNGRPVPDAHIHVSAGMGSLHVTGEGKTDADGRYRVTFGPRFLVSVKDRAGALQAAIVHVGKNGYAGKSLGEGGNLQMAWELTKQQLAGGWQPGPERTFLPGKPLTVDFVLVPAAMIHGTLIDKNGQPVANREIALTGDRLPPASSLCAATRTDAQGRFTFEDVSTQHAWSFSIDDRTGYPDRTPPDRFANPGVHGITLEADGGTLRRIDPLLRAPR